MRFLKWSGLRAFRLSVGRKVLVLAKDLGPMGILTNILIVASDIMRSFAVLLSGVLVNLPFDGTD